MTSSPTDDHASAEHRIQELTKELSQARGELAEAREQQAATAAILRVISSSPMDLKRVFAEMAASAAHHCGAHDASIFQVNGDHLRLVGHHGPIAVLPFGDDTLPLTRGLTMGRAVLDRRTIHVADVQAEADEYPESRARSLGFRTILVVPLVGASEVVGAIGIRRTESKLFSDKQIALLETFANQAVIAIENARLFEAEQARTCELTKRARELTETLEYQTGTSEILRVISSSPTDLQPTFDAIAKSARRLCEAAHGMVFRFDGELIHLVAHDNLDSEQLAAVRSVFPIPPGRGSITARAILTRTLVHVQDRSQDRELDYIILSANFPTTLSVPLLRDGVALGAITVTRAKVALFSERQVELLKTFADQAVIAIENTRLFEAEQTSKRELQESLEYQTATSEVLSVISRSKFELQPILDTLVESAVRLCQADRGFIWRLKGNIFQFAAGNKMAPEVAKFALEHPPALDRSTGAGRSVLERRTIHIPDLQEDPEYSWHGGQGERIGQYRTVLGVPLLRDGQPFGAFALLRGAPKPFSDKQIELVTTFADQAVIAIENTRLFEEVQARTRELTESLEQQTATADVLKVISRSALDVQKVLDALVESAARLCTAYDAVIFQVLGDSLRLVAHHGQIPMTGPVGQLTRPLGRGLIGGRAVIERRAIQVADVQAEADEYPESRKNALQLGFRTLLAVPLVHAGEAIGVILVRRVEVRPFTERQIELVNTFADQAVIAIENTRLLNELRDSVQQQTATANVLGVISRSAFDLKPVFTTVAESVVRLCEADRAFIFRFDGELLRAVATFNVSEEFRDWVEKNPIRPSRHSASGRAAFERRTIHIPDVLADEDYTYGAKDVENVRTNLGVPILKDDKLLGVILIFRLEVQPFTDKQIALVETFADQAAIAIENTRLFEEAQARTRELQEALKQQTATADVLKVISRSAFDLQPVLQTLVENAVKLGAASWGHIYRFDGEAFRNIADYGASREVIEFWQKTPLRPGRGSGAGRAAVERRTVHIPDILADAEYQYAEAQKSRGVRSLLAVPMLRGNTLIGVFALLRTEVRPFSQSEIELVETFADQAVIAIENTSLFEEVRERNRDLTALSEVGRAVSSTLDLKMVLKTVVERAVDLSATDAGSIFYYREKTGRFELGETVGLDEAIITRLRNLDIAARHSGLGESIAQRKPLHIPDLTKRESNPLRAASIEAGFRAALIVPLLSPDGPLGTLVLQRRKPGEFPEAIVSLMQSFADQSAIALENARLFNEIAEKSRELEIASQHKSQFVANMSHELRTPLAAILGYAELMQEGFYEPQGPKSLDALTRIHSNGKHLLGLINTVLDIAKIESGQFTLNMAEYAIESVVETVRAATESLAQNKKLVLKAEVAKSLPVGLGDEQRLTQVLLNLVGNAIKFTDVGEVRVSAKAVNGQFNVSVTDTGPGIPVEHQALIFEQFHQVDSSNTKAKSGTGLGLAIAKQIVEMHGGRIWVESTLGKGSTFQMELPTRAQSC